MKALTILVKAIVLCIGFTIGFLFYTAMISVTFMDPETRQRTIENFDYVAESWKHLFNI